MTAAGSTKAAVAAGLLLGALSRGCIACSEHEDNADRRAQNQFSCDDVDTTDICYSSSGYKCVANIEPSLVCQSQNNNPCIGQAPTCEQIREVDELWGVDNGNLCNEGWWMAPVPGSMFPISLAGGLDHNNGGDDPAANTHWHPFCNTINGVERIRTVDIGPWGLNNVTLIWEGALEKAGCLDHPAARPTTGLSLPSETCKSQNGNVCVGPAPTCEELRTVDELWGVDNGNLCDEGFWMAPEAGSTLPISISVGTDHTTSPDDPSANTHWHPFCWTANGIERIKTVETGDIAELWAGAKEKAGCVDHPAPLPQTETFSQDPTETCQSQEGNICIGPAPTCEQIREVDIRWGVDNGNLCNDGWWMAPEPGSDFPISIAGGIDHNNGGENPEANTHWHPFCNTINGVERIKTVDLGEDQDMNDATPIWQAALGRAGCGNLKIAVPATALSMPEPCTSNCPITYAGRIEVLDLQAAPTCEEIRSVDVLGVDGGDLCTDCTDPAFAESPLCLVKGGDPGVTEYRTNTGWMFNPEPGNLFPISLTSSTWHKSTLHVHNNTHWHGFCRTAELGIQRVYTSFGQGQNTCDIWNSVQAQACCPDLPVPRMGYAGNIHPEECKAKPTTTCYSQSGEACYAAPTCEQIREVDERYDVDNGDLCTAGYWMEPEPGNPFPMSMTTSQAHSHDPSVLGNTPHTNEHWHPFCMTKNGPERIDTVHGFVLETDAKGATPGAVDLWYLARGKGGCVDFAAEGKTPDETLPATGFTIPGQIVVIEQLYVEPTPSLYGKAILIGTFVFMGLLAIIAKIARSKSGNYSSAIIPSFASFGKNNKPSGGMSIMPSDGNEDVAGPPLADVEAGASLSPAATLIKQSSRKASVVTEAILGEEGDEVVSWWDLLRKMSLAQLITAEFDLLDLGTDAFFWLELNDASESAREEWKDDMTQLSFLSMGFIGIAMLVQTVHYLNIRRTFTRKMEAKDRKMKIAFTAAIVSLCEDLPQIWVCVTYIHYNDQQGFPAWTAATKLTIGSSILNLVWKVLTPALIKGDLL